MKFTYIEVDHTKPQKERIPMTQRVGSFVTRILGENPDDFSVMRLRRRGTDTIAASLAVLTVAGLAYNAEGSEDLGEKAAVCLADRLDDTPTHQEAYIEFNQADECHEDLPNITSVELDGIVDRAVEIRRSQLQG